MLFDFVEFGGHYKSFVWNELKDNIEKSIFEKYNSIKINSIIFKFYMKINKNVK